MHTSYEWSKEQFKWYFFKISKVTIKYNKLKFREEKNANSIFISVRPSPVPTSSPQVTYLRFPLTCKFLLQILNPTGIPFPCVQRSLQIKRLTVSWTTIVFFKVRRIFLSCRKECYKMKILKQVSSQGFLLRG